MSESLVPLCFNGIDIISQSQIYPRFKDVASVRIKSHMPRLHDVGSVFDSAPVLH